MKRPWSESRMREIRPSGLMSGEWKRSGLTATAPLLDSTPRWVPRESFRRGLKHRATSDNRGLLVCGLRPRWDGGPPIVVSRVGS
jgi:hypothetical protein